MFLHVKETTHGDKSTTHTKLQALFVIQKKYRFSQLTSIRSEDSIFASRFVPNLGKLNPLGTLKIVTEKPSFKCIPCCVPECPSLGRPSATQHRSLTGSKWWTDRSRVRNSAADSSARSDHLDGPVCRCSTWAFTCRCIFPFCCWPSSPTPTSLTHSRMPIHYTSC